MFHTITRTYDAASQLIGVTETDTVNPAATTAWQFAYDPLGNVVKSRMAPGEIVQQPTAWSGSLAAGDATIDWDNDGKAELADLITNVSVLPGDVVEIVVNAAAYAPAILLFQASKPGTRVWYESGTGQLVASRTADVADIWTFAVTARNELAAGTYDIRIVKNSNSIVSTALVEYDFVYDKAGNLLTATEDQAAVGDMYGFGPAASGLGIRTSYTPDALNRVTRYEQAVAATAQVVNGKEDRPHSPRRHLGHPGDDLCLRRHWQPRAVHRRTRPYHLAAIRRPRPAHGRDEPSGAASPAPPASPAAAGDAGIRAPAISRKKT